VGRLSYLVHVWRVWDELGWEGLKERPHCLIELFGSFFKLLGGWRNVKDLNWHGGARMGCCWDGGHMIMIPLVLFVLFPVGLRNGML